MRVTALGWSPVKGCSWLAAGSRRMGAEGTEDDRLWTPVTPLLQAVKATDQPQLAGLRVEADELPRPDELLALPGTRTVRYYDRSFPATVHRGPVAEVLSALAGTELWLARSTTGRRFIWSSPVSLLLASEIIDLPQDVGRYRANILVDDLAAPLRPALGARLRVGEVVLEVERELDRCLVVDHNPLTGERDAKLLGRLRPGVLLGRGCRVVQPGLVRLGDELLAP